MIINLMKEEKIFLHFITSWFMAVKHPLYKDLEIMQELFCDKCGFQLRNLELHSESAEYGACTFKLNEQTIEYRVSKITPAKTGQFVTLWKRNEKGVTAPFDISDDIDFIIIVSKSGDKTGYFIFPKAVLSDKGIISQNGKGGKRGIRVYPAWDTPTNSQAVKTQYWQTKYFSEIKNDNPAGFDLIKMLYENKSISI